MILTFYGAIICDLEIKLEYQFCSLAYSKTFQTCPVQGNFFLAFIYNCLNCVIKSFLIMMKQP